MVTWYFSTIKKTFDENEPISRDNLCEMAGFEGVHAQVWMTSSIQQHPLISILLIEKMMMTFGRNDDDVI